MSAQKTGEAWVQYNPMTHTYDTPDGTQAPTELADSATRLADVLYIALIRERQRAAIAKVQKGASHG